MVQTWNQCNDMLLTSGTKRESILLMDTETGATKSELSIRRQQKNWNLHVDSITPMQKFEQYKSTQEYGLYGLGDEGHTVFAMNHDTREGKNVEEFVIRADSHRKYKSYTFTCHAQLAARCRCVLDSQPGPVTSLDVAADGSMIAWTTPEFGKKVAKPRVLQLTVREEEHSKLCSGPSLEWTPVKFDATTHADVRWNVRHARAAWEALETEDGSAANLDGVVTGLGRLDPLTLPLPARLPAPRSPPLPLPLHGSARELRPLHALTVVLFGCRSVFRHMTVGEDMDVVALEGEIVKSLRF
ncbi:MAG: hypothetical protein SGPRY_006383 [Prymnesium sp.]